MIFLVLLVLFQIKYECPTVPFLLPLNHWLVLLCALLLHVTDAHPYTGLQCPKKGTAGRYPATNSEYGMGLTPCHYPLFGSSECSSGEAIPCVFVGCIITRWYEFWSINETNWRKYIGACIHNTYFFTKRKRELRIAKICDSPNLPEGEATYCI